MHAPLITIATDAEAPPAELGPAMLSLKTDKQRAFVSNLFDVKPGRGAIISAAVLAGYGTPTSSRKSLSVIASRLACDEDIQLAIEEEGRRRFRTLSPLAHHALKNLLESPKHRDHSKAVLAYFQLVMPQKVQHDHDHRHQVVDHDAQAVTHLRLMKKMGAPQEFLINIFGCNGLPRYERMLAEADGVQVIEAAAGHANEGEH